MGRLPNYFCSCYYCRSDFCRIFNRNIAEVLYFCRTGFTNKKEALIPISNSRLKGFKKIQSPDINFPIKRYFCYYACDEWLKASKSGKGFLWVSEIG